MISVPKMSHPYYYKNKKKIFLFFTFLLTSIQNVISCSPSQKWYTHILIESSDHLKFFRFIELTFLHPPAFEHSFILSKKFKKIIKKSIALDNPSKVFAFKYGEAFSNDGDEAGDWIEITKKLEKYSAISTPFLWTFSIDLLKIAFTRKNASGGSFLWKYMLKKAQKKYSNFLEKKQ